jgi:prepilin-type processing-associated H-X9-DG protein
MVKNTEPAKICGKRRRANGLTLFELLIVVGIIGVLVGLLLPAVQSARELARRKSCENKMQQLWLGVEAYRITHRVFPAGTKASVLPVENFPADNHQGWILRTMPEMGGGMNFVKDFDYSRSVYDPVNWPIAMQATEYLICPSSYFGYDSPAETSYVGIYDGRDLPLDANSRGALVANRFLSIEDFPDGLSTTAMIGEVSENSTILGWTSGTSSTLRTLGVSIGPATNRWRNDAMLATSMKYGWCAGDGKQSYEQFLDAAMKELASLGEVPDPNMYPRNEAGKLTLKSKEAFLLDNMSLEWEEYGFAEDATELGLSESGEGTIEPEIAIGMEEEFEYEDWYSEEEENVVYYPKALIGDARLATAGVGSFHSMGFNMTFVDGHVRHIPWTIDQGLFESIGIRDDALPLMLEP